MDCESPTPIQLAYSDGWKQGLKDGKALDTPEGVLAAMEGIARYFGEGQSYSWYDDHCASKGHNLNVTPLSDGELRYTVFWPEAKATRDEALALIGQEMGGKTE